MAQWEPAETATEVGRLYPAVYQRFHVSRHPVSGSDVTPRMLGALRHLAAAGPLTVGEQASHLGLSKATMTELVNRLEAKGLVDRMRDERDRRRVFVWLTDAGRERLRATSVLADDLLERAVEAMEPMDRGRLLRGLRALLEAADAVTDQDDEKNHHSKERPR